MHYQISSTAFAHHWLVRLAYVFVWGVITTPAHLATEHNTAAQYERPVSHAPRLAYVGCAVTDFRIHASLPSWANSRDLIGATLTRWFNAPPDLCRYWTNGTRDELRDTFASLAPQLRPNDIVVVYIGTHHLRDGRLLLSGRDAFSAADLGRWLGAFEQRVVLLADICYAEALEQETSFGNHVIRLYASEGRERTPDIVVRGLSKTVERFFETTNSAVRTQLRLHHDEYSLMGYMFIHALLHEQTISTDTILLDHVYHRMRAAQLELKRQTRRTKMPRLVANNLQPIALKGAIKSSQDESNLVTAHPRFLAITKLLQQPEDALDVGRANVMIGKIYDSTLDIDRYMAQLNRMAEELKNAIGNERRPERIIPKINELVYNKYGMKAEFDAYPEDFLLHKLLDDKRGRCAAMVSLFLALGKRTGLPLVSVCVPEHIFARWLPESPYSDRRYRKAGWLRRTPRTVNIETTLNGREFEDQHYHAMLGNTVTDKGRAFYMRPLSRRETIAALLSPLGSILRDENRLDEALAACRLALSINENDAEAWNNLGMIYRLRNADEMARFAYQRALTIHPEFAEVFNNLATLQSTPAERITLYQKALKLKPDLAESWKNLSFAYFEQAEFARAWACVVQCQKLGVQLPPDYIQRVQHKLK